MSVFEEQIAAYEDMRSELEAKHLGEWVIIHNRELVDVYDSFELAAKDAVRRFGRGPYLIRKVGDPPLILPVSVLYQGI